MTAIALVIASGVQAQNDDPIRIGAAYPLTGPAATNGVLAALGHDMIIDKINAEGGILGRRVESFTRDSKGTPADATAPARVLITLDTVAFIAGGSTSGEGLAFPDVPLQ